MFMYDKNRKRPFVITREMEEARARLEAFRDKIQPYPPCPETAEPERAIRQPEQRWVAKQWDMVNELGGEVRYLHSKINEMRAKAKGKSKAYEYDSIK